ncbi:hypothetical protein ACG2OD_01475 [Streptomyces sp. PDY-4]|uniref:hypothetical protein n=1 Tax=Streptomyces TaxID=1883 RepID=UPI0036661AF2
MNFHDATFSGGRVNFGVATFSGRTGPFRNGVLFHDATFSGSSVSFEATTGPVPMGLLAAVGTPVPLEVRLRADWLPSGP